MKLECKCLSASHGLKKGAVKKKKGKKKEKGGLRHLMDSFFSIPQRGEPDNSNYMLITPLRPGCVDLLTPPQ